MTSRIVMSGQIQNTGPNLQNAIKRLNTRCSFLCTPNLIFCDVMLKRAGMAGT